MSVLAAFKNFIVAPGQVFDYSFIFYQGSPGNRQTVDLTNATAQLNVVDGSGIPLFSLSNMSTEPLSGIYFGGSPGTPSNGIIDIHMDSTDTANFTWKYAQYNLTVTTESLGEQDLLYGGIVVVGFLP